MSKSPSLLLTLLLLVAPSLHAQVSQTDRVTTQPEFTTTVRIAGHLPRWANSAADAGPVPGDTNLPLTFVLSRAPQQQAAFTQLRADQQDPASPQYHQGLTPQQAGDLFGPTEHDIDAFTAWLAARGLGAASVSPSRIFVQVSAPASAIAAALSTSFHYFTLDGVPRLSTTQDPALPATFAAIVQTIVGLSDTPILPMGRGQAVSGSPSSESSGAQPRDTTGSQSHYVTPGDFANIFDLNAPNTSGIAGTGQRIAIVGRSRVAASDITEYEAKTGLAANLPTTIVPGAGPDPGYPGNADQVEATLDVDRVLGTAPSAQADLVVLSNNGGGIYTAAQYAVDTLDDPILNISFGTCESSAGAADVLSWDTLFSQAASQGISVFVCAMDSGAADCDTEFAPPPATQRRSINAICSSSYATCVGGTEFADTADPSLYWSSSNGPGLVSALVYIPEGAWNEPGSAGTYTVASGGGGASLYIAKPAWQAGTGVPADGARDVPDVSFPSAKHDGYYGCYALGGGNCANNQFEYFYGTSNAAPAMAAVTALLNQRTGARQGDLNPALYRLAANPANGVFHDATVASSGVAACSAAIPSMCNNSTPSPTSLTGGLAGFLLTPGYDLATGWGSIDVGNLLAALGPSQATTTLALSATSPLLYAGSSDTFTAAVSSTTSGTPTGFIQFFLNGVITGTAVPLPATGEALSPAIAFAAAGNNTVSAVYSGDAAFAAAKAPPLSFIVDNPGFSIAAVPASLTLSASSTAGGSAIITYTSLGGFTGTVTQRCAVTYTGAGSPAYLPTCSFTAPTVTLPANGTVAETLAVAFPQPGGAGASGHATRGGAAPRPLPTRAPTAARSASARTTLASLFFGALIQLVLPLRRRGKNTLWRELAMALATGLAFASISGCGGSNVAPTASGPAANSFTISITGSSGSTNATPPASILLTIQ